jgi:leucyl aminopeptidase
MTQIKLAKGDIVQAKADAIVVNLFKGVTKLSGATGAVDVALDGQITDFLKLGEFKGKTKEVAVLPTRGKIPSPRVILVGLGDKKTFKIDHVRQISARAATVARDRGCASVATIVHGAGVGSLDAAKAAYAMVEGAILGLYQFKEYRSKPKEDEDPERELKELWILESDAAKLRKMEAAVKQAETVANITNDVRTLVNRPSLDKTPPVLAETAQKWGKKYGFSVKVLEKSKLQELGMGGLLGVGAGSVHEPRMVILEKKGRGAPVLLVGKGITFDTGGISIKPAAGMEHMRHDMAGAAAVLGAVSAATVLGLSPHIIGLMPIAENMPSGSAIRPGDILRAYDSTTIEVLNTDAEGRLILADALGYGIKQYDPRYVVDIATLTGAIKVALGNLMTGLFSNDDGLAQKLTDAGKAVGDDLWRLPVNKEYMSHVKSEFADIKNTGVSYGGSITAAAFLMHFAQKSKWAHLDIAGTCWTEKGTGDLKQDYHAKGATAVGVRLFTEFLRQLK